MKGERFAEAVDSPEVIVAWLDRRRILKNLTFLVLFDGVARTQVLVRQPDLIKAVRQVPLQSLVRVRARGRQGAEGTELDLEELEVVAAAPPMAFDPQGRSEPPLRSQLSHPALRFRNQRTRAVFMLYAAMTRAAREHLASNGYLEVLTPKFLGNPSAGGAALLSMNHFDQRVSLSQSTQLYRQMLLKDLDRVFEFTANFHADPHMTRWHLNEFVALEAETSDIVDHHSIIGVVENLLRHTLHSLSTLPVVDAAAPTLPTLHEPMPRIHYAEALDILESDFGIDVRAHFNLTPSGNRSISAWAREQYRADFVALVGTPVRHSQFYDIEDPAHPGYTRNFVVLCRGISFVCGGQRLHALADYEQAIRERGGDAGLHAFLETIAEGLPPHGGFSVGIARWVAALCGLDNIRKSVLFPRDPRTLRP